MLLGSLTQWLWQILALAAVSVPLAGLGTLFCPLLVFWIMRSAMRNAPQGRGVISRKHLAIAGGASLLLAAVALAMPVPGRARAALVPQEFPGLKIALPGWPRVESIELFDNGSIKFVQPGKNGFVAVRWSDSDPVQSEEYVKVVTGGTLDIRDRWSTPVGGHEGTTFLLESSKVPGVTMCTIWNCLPDHRVLWITTYLNAPQSSVQATHQKIVESVACHAISDASGKDRVFPSFVPPPQFTQDDTSESPTFFGPNQEMIILEPGVSGRNPLVESDISPDMVASRITGIGLLEKIEGMPSVQTVRDALGHERKVWSALGSTRINPVVQVEWMVWYCDKRSMTFSRSTAPTASTSCEKEWKRCCRRRAIHSEELSVVSCQLLENVLEFHWQLMTVNSLRFQGEPMPSDINITVTDRLGRRLR